MLTQTKFVLAAALMLGTASGALASNPVRHAHRPLSYAGADKSYAFAPSVIHNGVGSASRPGSRCHHVFNYDPAFHSPEYDLICNGVDWSR
jgi:hypothetical protein